jgi:alkylation response protein AidB-like acyl-CoA dehydrogenase
MQRPDFNVLDDDTFRQQWRQWIAHNYRSELRNPLKRLTGDVARQWLRAQCRDGWRAPGLPFDQGGMGLSLRKQLIYQEELELYGVARPIDHGLRLLAPVLLRYGTPQQKSDYLPRILSCEDTWCQGYSEPNAGSDLANLKMSAVAQGDQFVVNGQKIWTTLATDANKIFILVRTSSEGKKQQGITFLLVDLQTPGIRVRPIRTLAGDEHFCEVFFDNVSVPMTHVVGAVGDGWSVGKALLGFERFSHGSPELIRFALEVLRETGKAMSLTSSECYQSLLTAYRCDEADASALYEQVCEMALSGKDADDEFSMLKLFNSERVQRIAESAMELAGPYGGILGEASIPKLTHDLEWLYMISRPLSIFGGTAQVQRNLIATRTLQLPKS